MKAATLAAALRIFATELERLEEAEADERRGWIDQAASPLGRRRHIAACRGRVGQGDPGAAIVGRRALLAPDALAEELARLSAKPAERKPRSIVARSLGMADRLELVRRGAR